MKGKKKSLKSNKMEPELRKRVIKLKKLLKEWKRVGDIKWWK